MKTKNSIILIAVFLISSNLLASSTGVPWESGIGKLADSFVGPVAAKVSLLSCVACFGGLAFGEQLSGVIQKVLILVLVLSALLGVAAFINSFWGSSGAIF